MGKTDIRKENRQQSDNAESDRSMEKRSILKIKKNFLAGVSLLIFLLLTVKVVQAIELGGFEMRGCDTGFGPVAKCTTDIQEAVTGVDYILVVTPAFAHRIIAELAAPYLKAGQTVVLNPGSVFGAIEFLNVLREKGNHHCRGNLV